MTHPGPVVRFTDFPYGEALVVGAAVGRAMRALIEPLPAGRRPDSDDLKVVAALAGTVSAFDIAFEDILCYYRQFF